MDTTIVYVIDVPDDADDTPSVLVIERSAVGVIVVVSVSSLFAVSGSVVPVGAVTIAVLAIVPVADPTTLASTVKVTEPDGARSTVAEMSPLPAAVSQVPPVSSVHVHVTSASSAGIVSVTTASIADEGPALVTTMV